MEGCQANSSSWKNIMGWLGWSSSGSPTKLYSGAMVETSPLKMAKKMYDSWMDTIEKGKIVGFGPG